MHAFDPARPRLLNGVPVLVFEGKEARAIGSPIVALHEETGDYWIGVFAAYEGGTARCYPCFVPPWAVGEALRRYYDDPESWLLGLGWTWRGTRRQYEWPAAKGRADVPKISLEDLGL